MLDEHQNTNVWFRQSGQQAWMMGVLNCTPDSFSDGGHFLHTDQAIQHGIDMYAQGAKLIDVGGESTRPGAPLIPLKEELRRVIPVVKTLVEAGCAVSIDTRKAEVMQQAMQAGACMINDVTALSFDDNSLSVASATAAQVCLMHMQGTPETMQHNPQYHDVMQDVIDYFEARIEACMQVGIQQTAIILDPGIGFGKRLQDNLHLIMHLDQLKQHFHLPILLGVSRKSLLGTITGAVINDREFETGIVDAFGIYLGADGIRVHDVALQKRANIMAAALSGARMDYK